MTLIALIDQTNEMSSNLQREEVVTLLNSKIEKSIMDERAICISIEALFGNCLNRVYVDDFEVEEDHIYLNEGNFEFNINLDDNTEITYENEYEEFFTISNKDTCIKLFF